jgi:addiction module RelE/StbE family toxin
MRVIHYSDSFNKRFATLPKKIQRRAFERIALFKDDPFHPILNNHPLHGEYGGYRSINVTGDMRIVYEDLGDSTCVLHEIGTHGQLYE